MSNKYLIASIPIIGGVILGIIGMVVFDTTLHATSTDEFCTSCHEMQTPLEGLRTTAHFNNHLGVTAGCADCHLPHDFIPKMVRKVEAAREVYGHFTGIIDTPEKYAAHLPKMKAREIARMRANDSAECRYCHDVTRMDLSTQPTLASRQHGSMKTSGKTCIDCHTGIAHPEETEDEGSFDL